MAPPQTSSSRIPPLVLMPALAAIHFAAIQLSLLVSFVLVTRAFGLEMPAIALSWYAGIVASFGILGFVVGYLVPSTAEAYIESNKLIRKSSALERPSQGCWSM